MQIFDSHFHIIDHNFPLQANDNYLPANYSVEDYSNSMKYYKVMGGAVVAGSFQGFDYTFIKPTLEKLGSSYVAVAQVSPDIPEENIIELTSIGVRGVRFNLFRSDKLNLHEVKNLAFKVHSVAGWHSEFYVDSAQLSQLFDVITTLPSTSIDHLGLSKSGIKNILKLAEQGTKIKASGFGRLDFEASSALQKIHSTNPEALMFGSDLPSTRASRKFSHKDINLVFESFSSDDANRILRKNALAFYRIDDT